MTKPSSAGRPIYRDNLIRRDSLILHLLPRMDVSSLVEVSLWLNKMIARLLLISAQPDRSPWKITVFDWLDSIIVAYHPFG